MRRAAILAALALPSCVTGGAKPQLVDVRQSGDGCEVQYADRIFTLPPQEEEIVAYFGAASRRKQSYTVGGNMDVPYKCLGGMMYLLQRAGVRHIDFVSEPPPMNSR